MRYKFIDIINKTGLVSEQDDAPPPPGAEAPAEAPVEAPETEPTEEVVPLSPESEVMLVRLLKKAFVIKPQADDITLISDMADINEKNAKENLQKLIQLMKSYSSDIDIDV